MSSDIINIVENLDDSYGGPARTIPNMSANIISYGFDVALLSVAWKPNEVNEVIAREGILWYSHALTGPKKICFSFELAHSLDKYCRNGNKIIHLHNLWNAVAIITFIITQRYHVPLVVSPRGSLYPWSLEQGKIRKKIAWRMFQKKMLNSAEVIHATDISEAQQIRAIGITSPIAIISNGVEQLSSREVSDFRRVRESRHEAVGRQYLFLSRVHKKKGVELLIRAWKLSGARKNRATLRIVGPFASQSYEMKIRNLIKSTGTTESVFLDGMVTGNKKKEVFLSSDIFILPSYTENYGVAIAEALAHGLPVITTKGTPWSEIHEIGAGWWIGLSIENLIMALDQSASLERNELIAMGEKAVELAQKHSWDKQAEKMADVYNWLSGASKPSFLYSCDESFQ